SPRMARWAKAAGSSCRAGWTRSWPGLASTSASTVDRPVPALARALLEQGALALVAGHPGGALELPARLVLAAQPVQQVATYRRQQVVARQRRLVLQRLLPCQCCGRPLGHRQGDRTIELDHR